MATKIVLFRESFIESVASDLMTVGIIVGGVWFNERLIGGSGFLNGVLLVLLILWVISKAPGKRRVYSVDEFLQYANELKAQADSDRPAPSKEGTTE